MSKILLNLAVCALYSISAVAQTTKDAASYAPTATGEQLTNLFLNSAILNGGQQYTPAALRAMHAVWLYPTAKCMYVTEPMVHPS
ncbi:hypothetical protein [Hoylesella saccharolytica]|uniref:hypothetical protein n=1 Tax=Hoylesella saccharolytica TaxID=633701 RepID=UPI000B2833ED|nr:hypothetical protein [Hoylesella saccharolytica]